MKHFLRALYVSLFFSIAFCKAQTVVITTPNGGEAWNPGSTQYISWTMIGVGNASVNLDYSIDSGATWYFLSQVTPISGSYAWVVPSTPSTKCLVRLTNAIYGTVLDQSDSTFTITNIGLGFAENKTSDFNVYPNPASSELFIESNISASIMAIKIVDVLGNVVEKIVPKNVASPAIYIPLNNIATGVYFVVVDYRDYSVSKKIMIR